MGRPRGEIFLALQEALQRVRKATRHALYKWLLRTGHPVSMRAVRLTLHNMVTLGHVDIIEFVRVPWSRRPICRYALVEAKGRACGDPLASVMAGWGRSLTQ